MARVLSLIYGGLCYLLFLAAFLYAICFVGNMWVPKTIDTGVTEPLTRALLINFGLLALFAAQHSVMARPWFKRKWTAVVPKHIERSTYVLLASLILIILFWQWRPLPEYVWSTSSDLVATVLIVAFWVGWGMVFVATLLTNHFDLFGIRQVLLYFQGKEYTPVPFTKRGLYAYVRHPLILGFIIAFWATPDMSLGHLFFAGVTTVYMLVAIQLEERDMRSIHGEEYETYQQSVSMLVPLRFGAMEDMPGDSRPAQEPQ